MKDPVIDIEADWAAKVARLEARCDELNEACSAKQVLIDHTASDLRDMRDLYEREKDTLHAELASARTVERKDLHEQIDAMRRLASCLASAVKCGEPWTDTLEREYRAVLAAQPAAKESK